MSRVAPAQLSFNGGVIAPRLSARRDQSFYEISLAAMVGYAPLVEGPAEAAPGTFHVAQAVGPCRLLRLEPSKTLGHVIEMSDLLARVYTNDALIAVDGVPVEVPSPYTFDQVQELRTHENYDVLYCFHGDVPPHEFVRLGAESFEFAEFIPEGGPFEPRNTNKGIRVTASKATGNIVLTATTGIFDPGDVGGLFKLEVEDFGDVTAWEPYISVTQGQLLTFDDRVYRVVGGNTAATGFRTGGLSPQHTEGVEWDGAAKGTDINNEPASGVRLEFLHDHYGIVRITAYSSPNSVAGVVERTLPRSVTGGNYTYSDTYYWDNSYGEYVEPSATVSYQSGTYRWAFGAFSPRRGYPTCGAVWNERLCLAKDNMLYLSVIGDLANFAELNDRGDASDDMAVIVPLSDPNPVSHLVVEDKLLALTSSGVHAVGPSSAARGIAPGNVTATRQNDAGCLDTSQPVRINSRTLYVDASARRIYETDYDAARQREQEFDLTRYARHLGKPGFTDLAPQQQPLNHLWAARGDGSLTVAVYLPEEDALGFGERPLGEGCAVRSITSITDPEGIYAQVWLAVEYGGAHHVLRMAPWRLDGEFDEHACMMDMAAEYDGEPATQFSLPHLPNADIVIKADGVVTRATTDADGGFTLPAPASRVVAGLDYPAYLESLDWEGGGDNGPAIGRKARIGRAWLNTEQSKGLAFGAPGEVQTCDDVRDHTPGEPRDMLDDFQFRETVGPHTRKPRVRVEREAPHQSTVLGWGGVLNMEGH